jgi:hypothetical protein
MPPRRPPWDAGGAGIGVALTAVATRASDCCAAVRKMAALAAPPSTTSFARPAASIMAMTALTQYSAGRYERVMASPGDCE